MKRRSARLWIGSAAALIAAVILLIGLLLVANMTRPGESLAIGGGIFDVEVMANDAEREQGLSGRKELPTTTAMLFVFPQDDKWGIWMKDMNFPIDIVWLDERKTVVYMKEQADPDKYPEIYRPSKNSRYVIEFAAGTIKDKDIRIGTSAKFQLKGED